MDGLPDWEAVHDLMLAPKPALAATVYALGKPPATVHLHSLVEGPDWACAWVDPSRLASLARASGSVMGSEEVAGRPSVVVDIAGLRGPAPVRVWVDAIAGSIVRLERLDDPAPLVVVQDLRESS